MAGDGKVKIDTELDGSGAEQGMSGLSGKLGSVAKAAVGAIAIAGTAVAGLVKKSVEGYGRYEQLVGGVETLYGAGGKTLEEYAKSVGKSTEQVKSKYNSLQTAQKTVLDNAANAYKTAGMSANQYMDTVTSFAAALTSSVGGDTEKAAKKAHVAIVDMADNANKMGTQVEMIQNAYQGFAKQNYTMLDNLKLGYGGTKSEMERLLKDAEKISGVKYDISSYGDIVDAIHVVQKEMGITGTTMQEAEGTIEGSVGMIGAAWENLVVGIADDNADFDQLIDNFVKSAGAMVQNILPRIQSAIQGVGKLITELGPIIAEALPQLLQSVLPGLLNAIFSLVVSLSQALAESLPTILQSIMNAVMMIGESLPEIIMTLLPTIVQAIADVLAMLGENTGQILTIIFNIFSAIVQAIISSIPIIINALPAIIQGIVTFFVSSSPLIIQAAIQLFMGIVQAIPVIIVSLIANAPAIIKAIVKGLLSAVGVIFRAGVTILKNLWRGISSWVGSLYSNVVRFAKNLPGKIKSGIGSLVSIGKNWIEGLWNGIGDKKDWLCNKIKELASNAKKAIKDFFGIKSPSRVMRYEVGRFITLGIGEGIKDETKNLVAIAKNQMDKLKSVYEIGDLNTTLFGREVMTSGSGLITTNWDSINSPTVINQEINFNTPNTTPIETARLLRKQANFGLAGGN